MGIIGFILSLIAALFLLISLIPILGWWVSLFITLPLSVAAAALSGFSLSKGRGGIGIIGLIISVVIFVLAFGRLFAGCGIF